MAKPMRTKCIAAVEKAIGRPLRRGEGTELQQRIIRNMRTLAASDRQVWQGLTRQQRLEAAAHRSAAELVHESSEKMRRTLLAASADARVSDRINEIQSLTHIKDFNAVGQFLADVRKAVHGTINEYFGQMFKALNSSDGKWFGFVEDAKFARDFANEVFGKKTGNVEAKAAVDVWLRGMEDMRQRINRAGGDVRKLGYGYIPQMHDAVKMVRAGVDKWVETTLNRLNRALYVDEDGALMTDDRMREMLRESFETLSTDGLNKFEPGERQFRGTLATRSATKHRELHFKDGDAWADQMNEFGHGGLFYAMQSHVARLARDITLLEQMGPDPHGLYETLHQRAVKAGDFDRVGPPVVGVSTQHMFDSLTGKTNVPLKGDENVARFLRGWRNLEVGAHLGSTLLNSIQDIGTYFHTTGFNRIPILTSGIRAFQVLGKANTEYLNRAGFIGETAMAGMNRFVENNLGYGWTSKVAHTTMKLGLVVDWTQALRKAASLNLAASMGKLSRGAWEAMDELDRKHLQLAGVTEKDFAVWQAATPDMYGSTAILTRDSLRAVTGFPVGDVDRAVTRFLAITADESKFASLAPDLYTEAALTRGTTPGSFQGELLRAMALFKAFPFSMITRHLGRAIDMWRMGDKASAVKYGAGLATSLTILGAVSIQLAELANQRNPKPMGNAKFWANAFVRGGAGGPLADSISQLLGSDPNTGKGRAALSLLGPQFDTVASLGSMLNAGSSNKTFMENLPAKEGAAFRFARNNAPLVNLWWSKGLMDHLVLHDIQEYLQPGYLNRIKSQTEKQNKQSYWLPPGAPLSDAEAPRLEEAFQ
jgi:hypothetical protein